MYLNSECHLWKCLFTASGHYYILLHYYYKLLTITGFLLSQCYWDCGLRDVSLGIALSTGIAILIVLNWNIKLYTVHNIRIKILRLLQRPQKHSRGNQLILTKTKSMGRRSRSRVRLHKHYACLFQYRYMYLVLLCLKIMVILIHLLHYYHKYNQVTSPWLWPMFPLILFRRARIGLPREQLHSWPMLNIGQ